MKAMNGKFKMKRAFSLLKGVVLVALLLAGVVSKGQNVGVGTLNPHPSAQLEMRSTNQGLLIPRLTTVQRDGISNPAHSLLIFNIDNFCLEAYDSLQGKWFAVSCPSTCNPCDTCPLPVIDSIVGLGSICPNDTLTYIIYGSGGLPVWVTPSSWVLLTPSDTARFISGNPGVLYGSLCNECGCVYDSIVLNMGSAPASVSIVGPQTSCVLDTLVLSASSSGFASYYSWQLPAGWTPLSPTNSASLITIPPSLGTFSVSVQACNGCGCSPPTTHTVNIINNPLNPSVAISGPSFVCLLDTIVLKAPHPTANSWTWFYPPSWQLISQGGDSIVFAPDSMNGNVIVKVCDTTSFCTCDIDTLLVNTDTCRISSFCLAIQSGRGYSIVQTSDGGFAIAGGTVYFGHSIDVYVVKLDANVNLQWTKIIDGASNENGYSIVQTSDGGYAIAGYTTSVGAGNNDVYVVKLDANGNLQWTKTIGGTSSDIGYSIVQTSDGGYATEALTLSVLELATSM